jgi:putative SOS response-associated peptidase YedK
MQPPQSVQPVVRLDDEGERELLLMQWGLVPTWSKERKNPYATSNAKAEELLDKPTFRDAF